MPWIINEYSKCALMHALIRLASFKNHCTIVIQMRNKIRGMWHDLRSNK